LTPGRIDPEVDGRFLMPLMDLLKFQIKPPTFGWEDLVLTKKKIMFTIGGVDPEVDGKVDKCPCWIC
jgi:hypothetical protein